MEKKALQLASVASMIDQFNMPNIQILQSLGYMVDVVADFTNPGTITVERAKELKKRLDDMGVRVFDVAIPRSLNPAAISRAYKKVKNLVSVEHYDLIHCHSPIGGVICRLAAKGERKKGTSVIYTAHGFHFYNGAPLKNWIVFFPIEKWLSKYTDVLITINQEDYKRAKKSLHAKKTVYVPGIGVDTEKFAPRLSGRKKIREELGLNNDDIMLLSVGELNENKNHSSVIKAIAGLSYTYVIVGKGEKKEELETLAKECGVDLRLTGFRSDVSDFYDAADVYVLPSIREGLNVSLMEAMASGLSVACGRIRGNTDLINTEECLFAPTDEIEIKRAIESSVKNRKEFGQKNLSIIRSFDLSIVEKMTSEIYGGGGYEHICELLKRQIKRKEIGIPLSAELLISVGELRVRKNHKVVVKALQRLDGDYWYIIVGKGVLKEYLMNNDKSGHLKLLGYRTEVVDLLQSSDWFVFPSKQEGLPVALMEAIAAGIPCYASRIRGNSDLIHDDNLLFDPDSVDELLEVISSRKGDAKSLGDEFSNAHIMKMMRVIYGSERETFS